ncbi:MAG: helix-turn-helix domain-containing protein [Nanoarchaeota archaeon]|nr:helix-turn-helix domain-containing protein [Nanoarchaeota archaeon]
MWVAKLRIKHEDCVIGRRCKRFNVTSTGTPFNYYKDEEKAYYSHLETLEGDEKKIQAFIEDLQEDPLINNVEVNNNSIFFVNEMPLQQKIPTPHSNKKIFLTKPIIVDIEGHETWEIGAIDQKTLDDFIISLRKEHFEIKVIKTENQPITRLHKSKESPELTKSQKKALEIATQRNYYDYPRKIELKDLAKESGISLSTFREHLRKAEKKIIPKLL